MLYAKIYASKGKNITYGRYIDSLIALDICKYKCYNILCMTMCILRHTLNFLKGIDDGYYYERFGRQSR